jgi:branched-chain amino acid transport system ATP-binding protein
VTGNGDGAILKAEGLVTGYGDIAFLQVSGLTLDPGEAVALLGANGSGKTTLLRTMMGLQPAWEGRILLEGRFVHKLPPYRRAALGMAMVPPGKTLFAGLTVHDNLLMGAYLERSERVVSERLERAYVLFPELQERRRSLAGLLSGGEQQMTAIARALMSEPRVLLIDELSQGLAPVVVDRLMERLQHIREEIRIPILFVEQDVAAASILADRGYVLREGRVELTGPMSTVIRDIKTQRAYLGL